MLDVFERNGGFNTGETYATIRRRRWRLRTTLTMELFLIHYSRLEESLLKNYPVNPLIAKQLPRTAQPRMAAPNPALVNMFANAAAAAAKVSVDANAQRKRPRMPVRI
jgi:hypothetical protein